MDSLSTYQGLPHTTVLHRPALKDQEGVLILIPGNPGLVEFYITYLDEIQKHRPELEIYAVSHAGFSTTEPLDSTVEYYPLSYQIQHKCDFITQIAEKSNHEKVPIYLLAHSMGAYVLQNVAKRLSDNPKIDFRFAGLICPTIMDIASSGSGELVTRIRAKVPVVQPVVAVASFLRLVLPTSLARGLVQETDKKGKSEEGYRNAIEACWKLFSSPRLIKQALEMAMEEMDQIKHDRPLQDWFFNTFLKKCLIWGFFAATDHWVADSTRASILEYSQKNVRFQVETLPDISHSFCVDQSVEFAAVTLEAMASK